jgi:hypothetical protein
MIARHWLADAGLAVLLALPTATLAVPSKAFWQSPPGASAPRVHLTAVASRFSPSR